MFLSGQAIRDAFFNARHAAREDWARGLALAAAAAILFSIAAAQILLGAAILARILAGRWRTPPLLLPFSLFVLGTLVSLAASADPRGGLPQIKKFFVFLILPVLLSALRNRQDALHATLLLIAAATLSSLWSLEQFAAKYLDALARGEPFYRGYIGARTTGLMSHWMTFSGQMMMAFTSALSLLLFHREPGGWRRWTAIACAILGLALILNQTRSVWLGMLAGTAYLLFRRQPRLLLILPVAMLLAGFIPSVRERMISFVVPHGERDSNQHRIVTFRTGLEMIQAHPWLGVGPDQVDDHFMRHVPADIPRPLPEGWYGHLHNIYLQYAAERGIPVLLVLLWLLGKMAWDWRSGIRRGDPPALPRAGLAALAGILVSGAFEVNLGNSEVLHLFLATAACSYAALPGEPRAPGAQDSNARIN